MQTRDIGFAVADFLADRSISTFRDNEGDLDEIADAARVAFVDVSNPSRPIVELDDGHRFQLWITRLP